MPCTAVKSVDDLIKKSKRVGIIGYPGAGKTTLSNRYFDKPVIHTDDFLDFTHDERPNQLFKALTPKDTFIVEGNEVTRLVNRGLELDCLILVTGSSRDDKSLKGLQGRVDKFINEYPGLIYVVNPREIK